MGRLSKISKARKETISKGQGAVNIIIGNALYGKVNDFNIFEKTPKIIHAIRWNPISNNKDDRIFRIFERFFKYQTSGWICNSSSARDTLLNYCGIPENKITFIYNGIEPQKLNLNKNLKQDIILTLANFAPRKGIIEYLDVIERVIKKNKNVKFIIAGRDDMNGLVQKEIKKKELEKYVETPGFVKTTPDLIKISKFTVISSNKHTNR